MQCIYTSYVVLVRSRPAPASRWLQAFPAKRHKIEERPGLVGWLLVLVMAAAVGYFAVQTALEAPATRLVLNGTDQVIASTHGVNPSFEAASS
eukprot:g49127.t1